MFPKTSAQAINLLKKMLTIYPNKRITVDQALNHPYFIEYTDEQDGPAGKPVDPLEFEF